MRITRPDLAALAVCIVAVLGIIGLTALHDSVPSILTDIALISLSAGVGIATQAITPTATPEAVSEHVAAPAPVTEAAPVFIPGPAAPVEAPVATHAP